MFLPPPNNVVGALLPKGGPRKGDVLTACNGGTYLQLSGNFDCSNRCTGSVNLGPDPGNAPPNTSVVIGITPHSFNIAGDAITASGMSIDFGNGADSPILPLQNGQGEQASTSYQTNGTYTVQGLAVQEGWYKANDWECRYRCCRSQSSQIVIQ